MNNNLIKSDDLNNFNELLDSVYNAFEIKDSDMIILPNPILIKDSKRTIWKNIKAFLKVVNRQPEHCFDFFKNQTGKEIAWYSEHVSDGLIFHTNKIKVNEIILLMKKYVDCYIVCNICKRSNTTMNKDQDLRKYKITCLDCNSSYCS
jgi:translation initiation factor 2 beta subunit (eIF-2beta)/eIF-5